MKLKIDYRKISCYNSKVTLFWNRVDADLYIVYLKKDDVFFEIAKTYEDTFSTVSLLPVGDNEFFVRAFKSGIIVDESQVEIYNNKEIDVISLYENNKQNIRFLYSKYPNADRYRLYRKEDENIFCKIHANAVDATVLQWGGKGRRGD